MVSSLARNQIQKIRLPAAFSEDFSDIFGPLPGQPSLEAISDHDPAVTFSHSPPLLGPTPCVSEMLNLNKLTLYETDDSDSLELVEGECEKTTKKHSDYAFDDDLKVGLEDFEVLKVVGQGAFGTVYQVRRSGSSEIYAMKVIRKDKILKKNHAKYMKSERDILTKVDHPFIVQLRYSFQVLAYQVKLW